MCQHNAISYFVKMSKNSVINTASAFVVSLWCGAADGKSKQMTNICGNTLHHQIVLSSYPMSSATLDLSKTTASRHIRNHFAYIDLITYNRHGAFDRMNFTQNHSKILHRIWRLQCYTKAVRWQISMLGCKWPPRKYCKYLLFHIWSQY